MTINFSNTVYKASHPVGNSCHIRQHTHYDYELSTSPIILVDHFIMTGPTFDLHPHAGMSAVTLLLEDSQGWMSSEDSIGNNHQIYPGDLHWTLAGKGIIHTQKPEGNNKYLSGLQIFVNLPKNKKMSEPQTFHLSHKDIPEIVNSLRKTRIICRVDKYQNSCFEVPQPIEITDNFLLEKGVLSFLLSEGHNMWIYVLEGSLKIQSSEEEELLTLKTFGSIVASASKKSHMIEFSCEKSYAHFIVISGPEMNESFFQHGPFVMSTREEVEDTIRRYQAGGFGEVIHK